MKCTRSILLWLLVGCCIPTLQAQEQRYSFRIGFHTGKSAVDTLYGDNPQVIRSMLESLDMIRQHPRKTLESITLTGHHVGIYGQLLTYDFEWGRRGYLADKWNYAAGVEYGYALPVGRRLNLDFVIGIGYGGGTCEEYRPRNSCYIRQAVRDRHWVGPTKAEISLVWLIGRGNTNQFNQK